LDSATSDTRVPLGAQADNGLKIVVVGGFGAGKTTLVRSVSEIRPLSTEETMTRAGEAVDDLSGVHGKAATTVAFDFGRITVDAHNVLYLFGAPGQERFWFLWDRLFSGTLGAVVLVDTRRIGDSWYAIDRLERHGTPFVVACNDFGGPRHTPAEVRTALDLDPHVPLIDCDARSRESGKRVLITLVEHVRQQYHATNGTHGSHSTHSTHSADATHATNGDRAADADRAAHASRGSHNSPSEHSPLFPQELV
jgi:signal recognition particle receptor subunit beta